MVISDSIFFYISEMEYVPSMDGVKFFNGKIKANIELRTPFVQQNWLITLWNGQSFKFYLNNLEK